MSDPTGDRNPVLLFDGECAVCRAIARWVAAEAHDRSGMPTLRVRPIGDDPADVLALNPALDIWDAYATIHVVMPDASMRLGGEAVAEVLRRIPLTSWFTPLFGMRAFGRRPFQALMDGAYTVLADVRPLLGCESCGIQRGWVKSTAAFTKRVRGGTAHVFAALPHFTTRSARGTSSMQGS